MGGEKSILAALALYERAALAADRFFTAAAGQYCANCLALFRKHYPADRISRHELDSGFFPGCCQAGVADDFRIGDGGERFSRDFTEAVFAQRAQRAVYSEHSYSVTDLQTGKTHEGRGCGWLGRGGCGLGGLKAPICLLFICEPLRKELGLAAGDQEIFSAEDLLGLIPVFTAVKRVSEGEVDSLPLAETKIGKLEKRVDGLLAALKANS